MIIAEVRVSAHAAAVADSAATSGQDKPVRIARPARPSSAVASRHASRSLKTVPLTCATTAEQATTSAATVGTVERREQNGTAAHRTASTSTPASSAPTPRAAYMAMRGWPASDSGPTTGARSR